MLTSSELDWLKRNKQAAGNKLIDLAKKILSRDKAA